MSPSEIEQIYPEFAKWFRAKGYCMVDGIHLIKLWYEYLKEIK